MVRATLARTHTYAIRALPAHARTTCAAVFAAVRGARSLCRRRSFTCCLPRFVHHTLWSASANAACNTRAPRRARRAWRAHATCTAHTTARARMHFTARLRAHFPLSHTLTTATSLQRHHLHPRHALPRDKPARRGLPQPFAHALRRYAFTLPRLASAAARCSCLHRRCTACALFFSHLRRAT